MSTPYDAENPSAQALADAHTLEALRRDGARQCALAVKGGTTADAKRYAVNILPGLVLAHINALEALDKIREADARQRARRVFGELFPDEDKEEVCR